MNSDKEIVNYTKNMTKKDKIKLILEQEYSNGRFVQYPDNVIDEDETAKLAYIGRIVSPYYFGLTNKYRQGIDTVDLVTLIGDSNISVLEWLMLLKENDVTKISFYISEAIRQNLITKKEAIEYITKKSEYKKVIPPPINIGEDENEWVDIYISLKEKYNERRFKNVEFDNNPFLNSNITDIIEQRAFLLDENDLIDISEDSVNNFELQRDILIKIFENLNQTGELESLVKLTNKKINGFNSFMDEETKFQLMEGTSDDVLKRYVEELKNYDFKNSEDDRVDFLRISRHIFNKYTKLIEDFECLSMVSYLDFGYEDVYRNTMINKLKKQVDDSFDEVIKFLKNEPSPRLDSIYPNDDGIVHEKQRQAKREAFLKNTDNMNLIFFLEIDGEQLDIKFDSAKIDANSDKKFYRNMMNDLIKASKEDALKIINRMKDAISYETILDDKFKNDFKKFQIAKKKYKEIKCGKNNHNAKPSFSEMVMEYYTFKTEKLKNSDESLQNINQDDAKEYSYEAFLREKYNMVNDFHKNTFREFYACLDDAFHSIFNHNFLIQNDMLIESIARFFDRKDKVYNLKHLNTIQLFRYNKGILFGKTRDRKGDMSINIGIDGCCEWYGGHYEITDPETSIENEVIQFDDRFNDFFDSDYGKVYLPLPKVTVAQKERFLKLSKYLQDLEENRIASNYGLEPEVCEKLQKLYDSKDKNENDYIAWKIQFALGAGKDRVKEVFEIKEIRKDNGEIDYKKLYEAEREKAQKARRRLEFSEKANKKLKSENKRIRLENDELNKQLQREKREHSGTKALLRKDITIMQRLLEFSEKVKKSRFGRFFFKKDIKLLDESKEIHDDKDER